jgi:hypothetical protein
MDQNKYNMRPLQYFAVTTNQVWNLGMHETPKNADRYAVSQFNVHQSTRGYLVMNYKELEAIKNLLDKRSIGIF